MGSDVYYVHSVVATTQHIFEPMYAYESSFNMENTKVKLVDRHLLTIMLTQQNSCTGN